MKQKYIKFFKEDFKILHYIKFVGTKFKDYEQLLFASAIDFYLTQLIGNKRNNIQLRIIPKENIMKGTIANVVLDQKALQNNNFTLNINKNVNITLLLKFIAHEIVHIAQIVNKRLTTQDFKTLQWDGQNLVSDKDYSKFRQKDINAYMNFPHEAEAYKQEKILLAKYLKSSELQNLKGINTTLDFIINNL